MSRVRILGLLTIVVAAVCGYVSPVVAADAVIYEVTESVRVGKTKGFKSSKATLTGAVAVGTALCPTWLATQLNLQACTIIVRALGRADDATGVGPASGDFDIAIQDANTVDGAELVVMKGDISGTIDLSPAFQKDQPLGSISGRFTASGVRGTPMANERASGNFTGTFRIPFRHEGKPAYLLDDGSVVKAHPDELLFGQGMVRLEVSFTTQAKDSR
jgi:hypothetical protein